jgi:hypothetical protein
MSAQPERCKGGETRTMNLMARPSARDLDAASVLLSRLAREHGLSNLRHGADPGEIVAELEDERSYFAVIAFEDAVEGHLGWRPDVVPAGAPGARPGRRGGAGGAHVA